MLYDETDHEGAAAMRTSIVAKAERAPTPPSANKQPAAPTHGLAGAQLPQPARRSRHLLPDRQATTALNQKYVFTLHTRPTPIQSRAFELLRHQPGSYPVTRPLALDKRVRDQCLIFLKEGSSD